MEPIDSFLGRPVVCNSYELTEDSFLVYDGCRWQISSLTNELVKLPGFDPLATQTLTNTNGVLERI